MDNSAAKDTLEQSWVHNHFIKPSETFLFTNKSGKMSHISLCIVKYILENKQINVYLNIYYKIKINLF